MEFSIKSPVFSTDNYETVTIITSCYREKRSFFAPEVQKEIGLRWGLRRNMVFASEVQKDIGYAQETQKEIVF